jgi:hypothetical protein
VSTAPVDRVLAALAGRGSTPRRSGEGWAARCPAHDDSSPSLSVSVGAEGRVVLHCHAGCPPEAVVGVLGLSMADLFVSSSSGDGKGKRIVATYSYPDENGAVLFEVVRFEPKGFSQRRPDGRGGWIWKLGDTRRILYRLPELKAAVAEGQQVWIAEGEKDAEALIRAGVTATCAPQGAGKWSRVPNARTILAGADVVIVADKDKAGYAHAAEVAADLRGIASELVVVEAAEGNDAADHLAAGLGVEDFVVIDVEAELRQVGAEPAERNDATDTFFVDWAEFWAQDRRDADWIFEDVLARGRAHAFYAVRKTGKSLLLLFVGASLATGAQPIVVIYLDFEMTEADIYERLGDMGFGPDSDLSRLRYALLPSLPPLDEPEGAKALLEQLDAVQAEFPDHHVVVIIDTTGRAVAGDENSADTIRNFYRWTGLALKRRGVTWARADHAGKDPTKGQRGSSAKGDDVDVIWKVTRSDDGFVLQREAARMSWVPEKVAFRQHDGPLRFEPVGSAWPAGTKEVAELLDWLDVAATAGYRKAAEALRNAGQGRSTDLVRAAQRWRAGRLEVAS